MKKIVSVSFCVLLSVLCFSQAGKKLPAASSSNAHLKVFDLALSTGDINTAITALNYYITDQGAGNKYVDTLAMLYMQQGAFAQCLFWADKRLQTNPEDNGLLEMKGISLDKLQQPKEAIAIFEKLFAKTKSPYHGYKLMEMQYNIKRLQECVITANQVEQLQFKPEYTMSYTVGDQTGRTYLQAGIFNIHGLALYDLDKKTESKTYFEKAVTLDSNFVLARQNLEALKTMEKNAKDKLTTPPQQTSPANKQ